MISGEIGAAIDLALEAAIEAGAIAREHFRSPMRVEDKLDGAGFDPVTEADRGIETFLRDTLGAAFPDHQIVGEEQGTTGDGPVSWVIDPIDGTRSFISGMPTWGTLIGLVIDGRPVAGIMHQPVTAETWTADPARGARYLHAATQRAVTTRASARLEDAIVYSTHPSMLRSTGALPAYERLIAQARLNRWGGDCYAFAQLAHGCIDLIVEGDLQPYDIVPLIPIIEAAGGIVTDRHGDSPINGSDLVIAAANRHLHSQAVSILR